MTRPRDIPAIDTLIGFRASSNVPSVASLRDDGKADNTIGYMFKGMPENRVEGMSDEAAIEETVAKMDAHGIQIGLVNLGSDATKLALRNHPDRFVASLGVDPNDIMGAVRSIQAAVEEYGIRAVTMFPSGVSPQVPIDDDRRAHPVSPPARSIPEASPNP